MTQLPTPENGNVQSGSSVAGAFILFVLGVLFLLSTGCFGLFGIAFLADGHGEALILVLCAVGMGLLTYFTFRGAKRLYNGPPKVENVAQESVEPLPPSE